jgi:L-serine dehydratase
MGPKKAAEQFRSKHPEVKKFKIWLYGSLAATGKGHLTGKVIETCFADTEMEIIWEPETFLERHPNAMKFAAYDNDSKQIDEWTAYSVGGGAVIDDHSEENHQSVYPLKTMKDILKWCNANGKQLWEYVEENEGPEIWEFLADVWKRMEASIKRGLETEGRLEGGLNLPRKAHAYKLKADNFSGQVKRRGMLFAFALAVSEENAAGGEIVTAPTCGAAGTLPAVLKYHKLFNKHNDKSILKALATAGLIGNVTKTNGSISGAEVGCQGEVGTACAMASAACAQLFGGTIHQIEYAAEIGMEHHLGLTCDPLLGLVQIPCIERNVFAAARALNHANYALLSDGRHRISFDQVVETMKKTGQDLPSFYKETSLGGLALFNGLAEE